MRLKYYLRAEKLGMVIPETQEAEDTAALSVLENGGTEAETEGTPEPADTENAEPPQEPDAQTSAEQQQPQQNASESQEPGAGDSGEAAPPEGGEPQQTVTITTTPGETCRQIAEDLKSHGLVADAEDFRLYMFRNNYDEKILQGSFTIPAGSTYEQIAAILTTRSQ